MHEFVLSTNARDEDNILEFIVYHLKIGFAYIFVIDHKSVIPIQDRVDELNEQYRDKVKVIRHETDEGNKCNWINTYVLPFVKANCSSYFIHLDADEYIHLGKGYTSIQDVVNSLGTPPDVLVLHWRLFGCSDLDANPNPKGHLMPVFTKCDPRLDILFKCLINREIFSRNTFAFSHPHWHTDKSITHTSLQGKRCVFTCKTKILNCLKDDRDPREIEMYINHYSIQSIDSYMKRKINRTRDDNMKDREKVDLQIIKKSHSQDECTDLKIFYQNNLDEVL